MPPLLTSLLLVFVGGAHRLVADRRHALADAGSSQLFDLVQHMIVPVLALALPIAAMFERLQAQAMADTVGQPFVLAALARGVLANARRLARRAEGGARPVASMYGLVIGSLLSGSFAVEMVTAWPGLGRLMLDALRARDVYLVAGCAAAGSCFSPSARWCPMPRSRSSTRESRNEAILRQRRIGRGRRCAGGRSARGVVGADRRAHTNLMLDSTDS